VPTHLGDEQSIELRHLRYFVAVAEELHFGRAAARLNTAQSSLSAQIRDLENELGVQLLHRTKRLVRPTDSGRAFLPEARSVLKHAEHAMQTAQRAGRGEVGRIGIGYVPSADCISFPEILRAAPFSSANTRTMGRSTKRSGASSVSGLQAVRDVLGARGLLRKAKMLSGCNMGHNLPRRAQVTTGPTGNGTTERKSAYIVFEHRPSDSPLVEKIWRCHSERGGAFLSVAASNFEMAVTRLKGKIFLTLRGPETKATSVDCPPEGEWLGIRFRPGTFMAQFLPGSLRDQRDVTLPDATSRSFWLNGSAWPYPDFDNAETFVKRLARAGVISRDAVVGAALQGQPRYLSLRSTQRHFLQATGITYATFRQIERARYATNLLRDGVCILDVVHSAGYFDQAHLTRSLKYLIGETPAKILQGEKQLSFLYKTEPVL
jgi:hypothetical protein